MQYRRLAYFVAVAEELSFTRAAERLHMAQPPLSQQIAILEKDLGSLLFDRSRRSIQLTPAGAILLPEARRLLADYEETARLIRGVGEGTVGRLTLGFVPSAVHGPLPELLRAYRSRYPDVDLVLREMRPDPLLSALDGGSVDVALLFRPGGGTSPPDLTLSRQRLVLALPEGHPVASAATVDLRDVSDDAFILAERYETSGIHSAVATILETAEITPRITQRGVWLMQTVLALVAAGLGVAIVPESLREAQPRGVTLLPMRGVHKEIDLVAVPRAGGSALVDNLMSLIPEHQTFR